MDDPAVGAIDHPVPAPPVEVVRSEERLRLNTRSEITGRVRISKRVVTEERVMTVTIRREELVVEHLPVDTDPQHDSLVTQRSPDVVHPASTGPTPVLELLLSEEEVEVSTRVVPRERVRVFIDTVTDSVDVSENVAEEVLEVDTPRTQLGQD